MHIPVRMLSASLSARRAGMVVLGGLAMASSVACAQGFPAKNVSIIVPFAAGGSTDSTARILAAGLADRWGKPVVVENKPGAGAVVGMELGVRAAPDGHTLTLVGNGMTEVPHLQKLSFDVVNDFAPITQILVFDQIVVATPAFPAKNIAELIALAKAKPDAVNFGSTGFGGEIAMSLLESMAGFKTVHVNYGGAGPVLNALAGGHVQVAVTDVAISEQLIKGGKIKALGLTGLTKNRLLPDVPTTAATVPGYEATGWFGLAAPGKTPRPVVDQVNRDTVAVLRSAEIRPRLEASGGTIIANSPVEFAKIIKDQFDLNAKIIREAGIKAN